MSSPNSCSVCSKASSSFCSNCRKVVYCGKEHQKKHRKQHRPDCFPAAVIAHPVLGHHLQATRDISAGEKILQEAPLITGPRSNLPKFTVICLGCCNQIQNGGGYVCFKCKWPVCDASCEQNPNHASLECPVLASASVSPASTQEEYLCITFLRCVLLQSVDPERWTELLKFESHVEVRKARPICVEQSHFAVAFIREKCGLTKVDPRVIDFVYGIIIVNGYGDVSTFAVKLYSKAAKLSHACIPNTRTLLSQKGLEIVAATDIKGGHPLTQLYGRLFQGTRKRQELLQNIYYFSCSCQRCLDPTELGTHFSSFKCKKNGCDGLLLPKEPHDISPNQRWKCNKEKCSVSGSFSRLIAPILEEIATLSGITESDGLYSEFEFYQEDGQSISSTSPEGLAMRFEHVCKMLQILGKLESELVHKNHYALLPLKTALIASLHSLLVDLNTNASPRTTACDPDGLRLFSSFGRMVRELLSVVEILLPGMTAERGLLLFYLSEEIRFRLHFNLKKNGQGQGGNEAEDEKEMKRLQVQALTIMRMETEDDEHRILVEKFLAV